MDQSVLQNPAPNVVALVRMRKIQAGKLAMEANCCCVIGASGRLLSWECAEVVTLPVCADCSAIPCPPAIRTSRNPFVLKPTSALPGRVPHVLSMTCNPQIGTLVIEAIPIDVIHLNFGISDAKDQAMEQHDSASFESFFPAVALNVAPTGMNAPIETTYQ